jgi:cytochrome b561
MDTRMMDHAYGYGLVSRFFHWAMALLALYQVFTATLHYFLDDTAITDFFFPGISPTACCCCAWPYCAAPGG